jgi:hypothetical protein
MKCTLCKCLNIIKELEKHPNESGFLQLARKVEAFIHEHEGTNTLCDEHRIPLRLNVDVHSICNYVNQVRRMAVDLHSGVKHAANYESAKAMMMVR